MIKTNVLVPHPIGRIVYSQFLSNECIFWLADTNKNCNKWDNYSKESGKYNNIGSNCADFSVVYLIWWNPNLITRRTHSLFDFILDIENVMHKRYMLNRPIWMSCYRDRQVQGRMRLCWFSSVTTEYVNKPSLSITTHTQCPIEKFMDARPFDRVFSFRPKLKWIQIGWYQCFYFHGMKCYMCRVAQDSETLLGFMIQGDEALVTMLLKDQRSTRPE
jgi:hypothetical protein